MRIKRLSAITVMALTLAALTLSACGGKQVAPPKDEEPGLRKNKAEMMERLD